MDLTNRPKARGCRRPVSGVAEHEAAVAMLGDEDVEVAGTRDEDVEKVETGVRVVTVCDAKMSV